MIKNLSQFVKDFRAASVDDHNPHPHLNNKSYFTTMFAQTNILLVSFYFDILTSNFIRRQHPPMLYLCSAILLVYSSFFVYLCTGIHKNSHKVKTQSGRPETSVSIVLAVKDEDQAIARCIRCLLDQNYPQELLEIIVVDDGSKDATFSIIKKIAEQTDILFPLKNDSQSFSSTKKSALDRGIRQAKGTLVLLTDGDCFPPPTWVASIVSIYQKQTALVAGFSPQGSQRSKLWDRFLFIDSLAAAFVAAGTIGHHHGVTCTGRNLSYNKTIFASTGGFDALPDSLSGDDDFVLQHIARQKRWQIVYAFSRQSHVPANGPENFSQFIKQKQRHLSAGRYFTTRQQTAFGGYHLSNYVLWISALCGFFFNARLLFLLPAKLALDWFSLRYFAASLERRIRFFPFLLWQALFPIYNIISAPVAFWGKIRWKAQNKAAVVDGVTGRP
jgi:glycosyltransferase involved in cell wall biosynthesis